MENNCNKCAPVRTHADSVPFVVYETSLARQERQIKRLWIVIILMTIINFCGTMALIHFTTSNDFANVSTGDEQQVLINE